MVYVMDVPPTKRLFRSPSCLVLEPERICNTVHRGLNIYVLTHPYVSNVEG